MAYETLGVLAGAYKVNNPASYLLHVAARDTETDCLVSVLCSRVKLDNLCPDGYTDAELQRAATCPICAKRDPRTKPEAK